MQDKSYVFFHTSLHSERVALIVSLIVDELEKIHCYPELSKSNILMLSLQHDIGKYNVRPELITKPDKLTLQEREEMNMHAFYSYEMLKSLELDERDCRIVRWHHEKLDGSGYPDGISGSQIPIETQIITVADIYDAMTSERPYRKREFRHEEAIHEMKKDKGLNQELVNIVDMVKPSRYKYDHIMSRWINGDTSLDKEVVNLGYLPHIIR